MALCVYLFVAVASAVALVWRHPLAEIAAHAAAPIGAAFTFVCLATGSLWGRPMWGTWWVWDARLTSVLVLFFLYLGYIALVNAFDDPRARRQSRLGAGAWSGSSTCRSSNSRSIGGTRCTSRPASCGLAGRRSRLDAGAAVGHGDRVSRCCSWRCCCCACAPYSTSARPWRCASMPVRCAPAPIGGARCGRRRGRRCAEMARDGRSSTLSRDGRLRRVRVAGLWRGGAVLGGLARFSPGGVTGRARPHSTGCSSGCGTRR